MNKLFYLAIALYIASFFLPVYDVIPKELSIKGYECAYDLAFNFSDKVAIGENKIGHIVQYIVLNLANPLIIAYILSSLSGFLKPTIRWWIGNIALISAVIFMPYFFMTLFSEFSYGYFSWLTAIILLNYFGNNNSFNKPKTNE